MTATSTTTATAEATAELLPRSGERLDRTTPAAQTALERLIRGPLKPRPDNVTPPQRTPWGGVRIFGELKAGLPLIPRPEEADIVGESWEISDDPAFPSRFPVDVEGRRYEVSLEELLEFAPEAILGPELAELTDGRLPLLAKIIDAAENLSVQVHPARGDAVLAAGESGKTEAWIVLARDEGAGVYVDLADDTDRDELAAAIAAGDDLRPYLRFIAVEPGDVIAVPAGTVHAIGAGCLLLEIQRFSPPSSGATYRLWDWNRLYDERGRQDPAGKPRALHVDKALSVIRTSEKALHTAAPSPTLREAGDSYETRVINDLDGLTISRLRVSPGAPLPLATAGRFVVLTCTAGSVTLLDATGAEPVPLRRGESVLLPATLGTVELRAHGLSELFSSTLV